MQELERRSSAVQCKLPVEAQQIHTPLQAEAWQRMLADHPDRQLVEWMVRGIRQGFRMGFQQDPGVLKQTKQNLLSVKQHPEVVQEYLDRQQKMGRVFAVGKLGQAAKLGVHCSPFGVIPKKGKAGRWRLIVDLSSPAGVNDGISAELSSLSYTLVDEVMRKVLELGRGARMAKADIKSLPEHSSASRGQGAPGHAVARRSISGWMPAIWPAVSPPCCSQLRQTYCNGQRVQEGQHGSGITLMTSLQLEKGVGMIVGRISCC